MSKRPRDTSWDLPAGIRATGINNLTQALGLRSAEIVERFNSDPCFTSAARDALIALYDEKATRTPRSTMEQIKQIMGGRCFLPDEAGMLLDLQSREVASIPRLTGRQIEKLKAFLTVNCPILGNAPAAQTHILFPQPSTISGATFSMQWVLETAKRKFGIEFGGSAFNNPIPDTFYNRVRDLQWRLMFWGPGNESAIPPRTDVEQLFKLGYGMTNLAIYTLALGYMKLRGVDVRARGFCVGGTSARLLDGLHAHRTVDGGLNVYSDNSGEPALVIPVPLY